MLKPPAIFRTSYSASEAAARANAEPPSSSSTAANRRAPSEDRRRAQSALRKATPGGAAEKPASAVEWSSGISPGPSGIDARTVKAERMRASQQAIDPEPVCDV